MNFNYNNEQNKQYYPASIPTDKLELAKVRSGYAAALTNLQMAQQKLADCSIKAPFDGVIANITNKVYENMSSEPFCTLIDDSSFEVSFKVLESELLQIALSRPLIVIPFANQNNTFSGSISEINPVVERNGLVGVKAIIKNNGDLIEGGGKSTRKLQQLRGNPASRKKHRLAQSRRYHHRFG